MPTTKTTNQTLTSTDFATMLLLIVAKHAAPRDFAKMYLDFELANRAAKWLPPKFFNQDRIVALYTEAGALRPKQSPAVQTLRNELQKMLDDWSAEQERLDARNKSKIQLHVFTKQLAALKERISAR